MKSYVYKMKLVEANFFALFIYILLFVISYILKVNFIVASDDIFLLFILLLAYFFLHELLHGLGYYLGGAKRELSLRPFREFSKFTPRDRSFPWRSLCSKTRKSSRPTLKRRWRSYGARKKANLR